MKKLIGVICLFICVITAKAQEEKSQYIRKGLLRSMATISPGIMLKENVSTISLHGTLEYYLADNVSLRGDSYYFLNGKKNYGRGLIIPDDLYSIAFNHVTFSGASYHFKTKSHFDPYIAIEPGISIAQASEKCPPDVTCLLPVWEKTYETTANPLISTALGFNFYFQKLFHLFGEARYISGKYLSNAPSPLSLNELRFSFGLGFNLNLIKKK